MMDIEAEYRRIAREEALKVIAEQKPTADALMTTAEAADFAKCSVGTIRRYLHSGKLTTKHLGRELRVVRAELERLLSTDWKRPAKNRNRPDASDAAVRKMAAGIK